LDGQRRVLRKAWAEHGGTEMGTEGDSFFVVFPTAERAVAAAVGRSPERVHVQYAPAGAGRQAFGGVLVKAGT